MSDTQAEQVAEAHAHDQQAWRRYQRRRRENPYEGDWGELVTRVNELFKDE